MSDLSDLRIYRCGSRASLSADAIRVFDLVDAAESWMPGTTPGITERVACASPRRSMQARRLEEAVAVGRHDGLLEGAPVAVAPGRPPHARPAPRPDTPAEGGHVAHPGAPRRQHH